MQIITIPPELRQFVLHYHFYSTKHKNEFRSTDSFLVQRRHFSSFYYGFHNKLHEMSRITHPMYINVSSVICCQHHPSVFRPHDEKDARKQSRSHSRTHSYARAESDMPETTTLSKRNLGPRPTAVTRVETKLPRCVQHRLPCAPVPGRCHPRSSPYRCTDHRVPKRPYRLAVGLSVTRTGHGTITSTSIPKSCSNRCPPGFLAIGTPRKKSLSMMDLTLPVVDPDICDLK